MQPKEWFVECNYTFEKSTLTFYGLDSCAFLKKHSKEEFQIDFTDYVDSYLLDCLSNLDNIRSILSSRAFMRSCSELIVILGLGSSWAFLLTLLLNLEANLTNLMSIELILLKQVFF